MIQRSISSINFILIVAIRQFVYGSGMSDVVFWKKVIRPCLDINMV